MKYGDVYYKASSAICLLEPLTLSSSLSFESLESSDTIVPRFQDCDRRVLTKINCYCEDYIRVEICRFEHAHRIHGMDRSTMQVFEI